MSSIAVVLVRRYSDDEDVFRRVLFLLLLFVVEIVVLTLARQYDPISTISMPSDVVRPVSNDVSVVVVFVAVR